MTLLSRIFGLLRDITLATLFGASGGTDAFLVAFKIPNFMRRLFGEGAFSLAFVPVLSEYREKHDKAVLKDLINHVAGTLGGFLLLLSVLGMVFAPVVVYIFAPGFAGNTGQLQLTADLLRITFPYIFFIALVAFSGGILNSFHQFAVPAFTPVLLNICLIASAFYLAPYFEEPLMALAWGVAIAGVVQLLIQFPALVKLGLMPLPKIKRGHAGVKKIIKLMIPAIFGSSVAQINLLLDTVIASFLITGSVTWLYYSDRLLEFPLGVLGIAIATVILPTLSQQHARASAEQFNQTLNWALRLVTLIAIPAGVGLFILAGPILSSLFEYGKFTTSDTYFASLSLMAYMLGLPALIAIKILAPGYYARQDTRTPVRIGIIAMVCNMFLNLLFVLPMVMLDYEAPHVGLALATSFSAYINAVLLYKGLRDKNIFQPQDGWAAWIFRIIIASMAMAAVIFWLNSDAIQWSQWALIERLKNLLLIIISGASMYFIMLWLQGVRPAQLKKTN
ncbi:Proposed peptidoglycan lipid II flippase MurJ [hydrothermal vent metagenome]|uniref:Proposed peptidoglycan lipid II flippase MurJ n=1 Tax=hydrothermal vent metagenome TaxID=652676 RepID=A0A3B0WWC2_9ZZZZ